MAWNIMPPLVTQRSSRQSYRSCAPSFHRHRSPTKRTREFTPHHIIRTSDDRAARAVAAATANPTRDGPIIMNSPVPISRRRWSADLSPIALNGEKEGTWSVDHDPARWQRHRCAGPFRRAAGLLRAIGGRRGEALALSGNRNDAHARLCRHRLSADGLEPWPHAPRRRAKSTSRRSST